MAYKIYCVLLLAFVVMSICVWLTVANSFDSHTSKLNNLEENGELLFAHVLYRHGDRSPVYPAPGSQYNDISYWPEGWGQLTTLGVQQEYSLGQWLRRRYNNFLSSIYNVNEIYVQSSDVDRTLMSAQSTLAGLYPPLGNKIWNRNILWQPIPVHTKPYDVDYLIAGQVPSCPSYQNALNEYMNSDKIKQFQNSIQPIYDYLTLNTGVAIDSIQALSLIRDSWLCESIHNFTLPQWAGKLYPNNEEFDRAALEMYYLPTGTKFMAKFVSGFLLKGILDRFTSKIENTLSPNRKFWIYSSHDSSVFGFLHSLDISDNNYVPYAAAIIVELRKYQNEHYIQIFYKNSVRNPEPIMIPGCGTACPLRKMYELYDEIIPENDFHTECRLQYNKEALLKKLLV